MKNAFILSVAFGFAFLMSGSLSSRSTAEEARPRPVVLELYTSQGCSSCPPANKVLADLGKLDGVIALSFSVDYWNYLGWRDTFSKPEFTQRQYAYAQPLKLRSVYTPQLVIDGMDHMPGARQKDIRSTIESRRAAQAKTDVSIGAVGGQMRIHVEAAQKPAHDAAIWVVDYMPGPQEVAVGRGENRGRTIAHFNVVTGLKKIGEWKGQTADYSMPACKHACAILVQDMHHGEIIGAADYRVG